MLPKRTPFTLKRYQRYVSKNFNMGSAFDRLSGKDGPLFAIQENTALVAETFGEDGEIFDRIDRMVTAIEGLAGKAGAKGDSGLKEAIVLNLVAPTLKPIGLGMGFIVEALNAAPDGEVPIRDLISLPL